jgi:hypothetical protein
MWYVTRTNVSAGLVIVWKHGISVFVMSDNYEFKISMVYIFLRWRNLHSMSLLLPHRLAWSHHVIYWTSVVCTQLPKAFKGRQILKMNNTHYIYIMHVQGSTNVGSLHQSDKNSTPQTFLHKTNCNCSISAYPQSHNTQVIYSTVFCNI